MCVVLGRAGVFDKCGVQQWATGRLWASREDWTAVVGPGRRSAHRDGREGEEPGHRLGRSVAYYGFAALFRIFCFYVKRF